MKNKIGSQKILGKNQVDSYNPTTKPKSLPLMLKQGEKMESAQVKPSKPRQKCLAVVKYEISDNTIKFFGTKGVFKKRWVIIKEIPCDEITSIEIDSNKLALLWSGVVYMFELEDKSGSFDVLNDQIQYLLEAKSKNLHKNEEEDLKVAELIKAINSSLGLIDTLFNILINFNDKRINWILLEDYSKELENEFSLIEKPNFLSELNFSKISSAIQRQNIRETTKETFNILETIYEFFDNLADDHPQENIFNNKSAKLLILAYYALNDFLLGKVVGEKGKVEDSVLLNVIIKQYFSGQINFKDNFDKLTNSIDKLDLEADKVVVFKEPRMIFRELMKTTESAQFAKELLIQNN